MPLLGEFEYLQYVSLAQKFALTEKESANGPVQAQLSEYCLKCVEMQEKHYRDISFKPVRHIEVGHETE